jgi:hypothetical protein
MDMLTHQEKSLFNSSVRATFPAPPRRHGGIEINRRLLDRFGISGPVRRIGVLTFSAESDQEGQSSVAASRQTRLIAGRFLLFGSLAK